MTTGWTPGVDAPRWDLVRGAVTALLVGLVLVASFLEINGVDLAPDAVGYVAWAVAARRLHEFCRSHRPLVHVTERLERAAVLAVVLAVAAIGLYVARAVDDSTLVLDVVLVAGQMLFLHQVISTLLTLSGDMAPVSTTWGVTRRLWPWAVGGYAVIFVVDVSLSGRSSAGGLDVAMVVAGVATVAVFMIHAGVSCVRTRRWLADDLNHPSRMPSPPQPGLA